jgi:outer membrane protein TolC
MARADRNNFILAALLFVLFILYSLPSLALQPVEVFAAAARSHNPDSLEAQANVSQQDAQALTALGRVLPGVSASGSYARNEYLSVIVIPGFPAPGQSQPVIITPLNQWSGTTTVSVPLIDLANFRRVSAARTTAESTAQQRTATGLTVESQVGQYYFQLVANIALVGSSKNALDVSREGLRLAEAQFAAGAVAVLDVDRARADVEQQVQQVASAERQGALAARSLRSASGVAPDLSGAVLLTDDLHPERELTYFENRVPGLPSVAAASLSTQAAEQQAQAQRLALAPKIAGTFTEYLTNTPALTGHNFYYQVAITLTWTLDLTNLGNIRNQDAQIDVARARELRTRLNAGDGIHQQWATVIANIARSRSARVGREYAFHASALARQRYAAGTITQLELLQAQRDAFTADVNLIQADANLVNARLQLRIAAGDSLLKSSEWRRGQ